MSLLKAKVFVVVGAALFSTGGVAIKLSALSGWQVSCLRSAIAAVVLGGVLLRLRARWTWRAWIVAVPYATTFTLYALANKLTAAANAIFLQDTAPLYILFLGPLLLRETARGADLVFMLVLAVGLGLIFFGGGVPGPTAADPALGNMLAAASGLSWALTLLGLRWLAIRAQDGAENPLTAIVAGCILASLVGAVFALPLGEVAAREWAIMAYLGVFQIALAYLFVASGIRETSALGASLLLLVEPVLTPVWTWLFLSEVPAELVIVGGVLVLAATIAYSASQAPPRRA